LTWRTATAVLHSVGNALNSANVSAGLLRDAHEMSKVENLSKVADLLSANKADLGAFFTTGGGRLLPQYIDSLVESLTAEHSRVSEELRSPRKGIDNIKVTIAMQQSHTDRAGLAGPEGSRSSVGGVPELPEERHKGRRCLASL
jgi:hypothetical protein